MPAGFREGYGYQVIGAFFPNGSQDLHFFVVNESGVVVPLMSKSVVLLDPNDPGYRNNASQAGVTIITGNGGGGSGGSPYSGSMFGYEFPINTPSRVWTILRSDLLAAYAARSITPVLPVSYVPAHALCLDGTRRVVGPTQVYLSSNPSDAEVMVTFSIPVAGSLIVGYRSL